MARWTVQDSERLSRRVRLTLLVAATVVALLILAVTGIRTDRPPTSPTAPPEVTPARTPR